MISRATVATLVFTISGPMLIKSSPAPAFFFIRNNSARSIAIDFKLKPESGFQSESYYSEYLFNTISNEDFKEGSVYGPDPAPDFQADVRRKTGFASLPSGRMWLVDIKHLYFGHDPDRLEKTAHRFRPGTYDIYRLEFLRIRTGEGERILSGLELIREFRHEDCGHSGRGYCFVMNIESLDTTVQEKSSFCLDFLGCLLGPIL